MSDPNNLDPIALRHSMRAARKKMDAGIQAQILSDHFFQIGSRLEDLRVAAYLPFDGEADPSLIMRQLVGAGGQCFVPVIAQRHELQFRRWIPDQPMVENRFGIPEPGPETATIDAQSLDLVLMPLVAFDACGTRLGMGGGYYDRAFSFILEPHNQSQVGSQTGSTTKPDTSFRPRPCLLGFGYDCQGVSKLRANPWDVPLDGVITESGLQVFDQPAYSSFIQRVT